MNVSLSNEYEPYQSKLAELRREIAIGLGQAEQGQVRPFTEETAARVKARGRKRRDAESQSDPA